MSSWIVDTGPIVAWFCPKDSYHEWSQRVLGALPAGGFVCEAVLAEACHLVARDGVHPDRVIEFVNRGALQPFPLHDRLASIRNRMIKYRDQHIDFADGCVLELANLNREANICTLDKDFRVYRFDNGESLGLIAPFG